MKGKGTYTIRKGQYVVKVDPAKCTECYICQLHCSLAYKAACNIERAKIKIDLPRISFTEECTENCTLCMRYCPREAITFTERV